MSGVINFGILGGMNHFLRYAQTVDSIFKVNKFCQIKLIYLAVVRLISVRFEKPVVTVNLPFLTNFTSENKSTHEMFKLCLT